MRRLVRRGRPVRIFVNYRREDASGHAGWLYEALSARYGQENVFMDVDTILPGEDFHQVLGMSVAACDVLVAVIGRHWLDVRDEREGCRIDDPDDWVRIEIESALTHGVRVIPALVDGAHLPPADQLPEPLRPLATRQAIELTNERWRYDVGRMIGAIDQVRGGRGSVPRRPRRRVAVAATVIALAAAGAVVPLVLLGGGAGALGKPADIAFYRNDGIYRMDSAGTHVKRLFESDEAVSDPVWSPDAKDIAFAMGGDIWLLRAGSKPKDLTNDTARREWQPTWSPDGKRIAFSFTESGGSLGSGGLGMVDADGGDVTVLLSDTNYDGSPAWSPDGKQIAFSTARGHVGLERDIYTLTLRDRSLFGVAVTKSGIKYAIWRDHPSWSPDGKLIAYDTNSGYSSCTVGCAIWTVTTGKVNADYFTVAVPPASATGTGYSRPTWIDRSNLLLSYDGKVWKVPRSGGTPEQVGSESNVISPTAATRARR